MTQIRTAFFLLLLPVIFIIPGHAQQFAYRTGYFGFFDNREYFNEYVNDQTIFGSRIYGELGYAFNENNRIMAGADFLYEFGSKGEWNTPDVIAYYYGQRKNAELYLGAFPRVAKIDMPIALMSDTIQYYRPNVEGILIDFKTGGFRHNIWIDWTSRQSYNKKETFLLGFSGFLKKGIFIYQHHFVMTHLAHSLSHTPDERIRDNGGFMVLPGLDLSRAGRLDSLTLSAGILGSYDRLRGIYEFRMPVGFYGEILTMFRGIGLKGTIYSGDNQIITSGDGFYESSFYSRADVFYQASGSNIEGRVQCSMHYIPGTFDLSMSLLIRARLEGFFRNHQSN